MRERESALGIFFIINQSQRLYREEFVHNSVNTFKTHTKVKNGQVLNNGTQKGCANLGKDAFF